MVPVIMALGNVELVQMLDIGNSKNEIRQTQRKKLRRLIMVRTTAGTKRGADILTIAGVYSPPSVDTSRSRENFLTNLTDTCNPCMHSL